MVRVPGATPDSHLIEGEGPEVLDVLPHGVAELAIWRRELPPELASLLATGVRRLGEPFERELSVSRLDALRSEGELLGVLSEFDGDEVQRWLLEDLLELARRVARVAGADKLRIFFGRVDTDRCRKFHVDYLRLRALTTYLGPATEWIHPRDVERAALARPAECPLEANRHILRPGAVARRANPGDVLLLKGTLFDARSMGAVHRSPPIERAGLVRLVAIFTPLGV